MKFLIYLYRELSGQHNTPHVHAQYSEFEMSIAFDGHIIVGDFPSKQQKLVVVWVALYEDELKAAWKAYNESGYVVKIKGLE